MEMKDFPLASCHVLFVSTATTLGVNLLFVSSLVHLVYVFVQITLLRKAFSTCPAVVWKIIGVSVQMKFEIRHLVKGPVALVASKRFFSRVNHNMISQVPLLVKALTADVTNESFLVAVRSKMSLQRRGAIKTLTTFLTLVWFFLSMYDLVATQRTGQAKPLSANVAYKRSALSVIRHFQVNRQSVFCFENFATLVTSVNGLICSLPCARSTQIICFI